MNPSTPIAGTLRVSCVYKGGSPGAGAGGRSDAAEMADQQILRAVPSQVHSLQEGVPRQRPLDICRDLYLQTLLGPLP